MNTRTEKVREGTIWKSYLSDRGRNGAFCSLGCSVSEGERRKGPDTGDGHRNSRSQGPPWQCAVLKWYSDLSWSCSSQANSFSLTPPRMGPSLEFTCVLLAVSTLTKNLVVFGGCSGKCCQGRDLDCFTTDWRMDRVYGTCYCDQGCLKTKDCCFDYFTECPGEGGRIHLFSLNIYTCFVPLLPVKRARSAFLLLVFQNTRPNLCLTSFRWTGPHNGITANIPRICQSLVAITVPVKQAEWT